MNELPGDMGILLEGVWKEEFKALYAVLLELDVGELWDGNGGRDF